MEIEGRHLKLPTFQPATMSETPRALQSAQEQALFEQLFEFSPDAIVVTDSEGRITNLNAQVQRAFGYAREELIGKPVETLIPKRFRSGHPNHRKSYNAQPSARPMGAGLELYGLRKNGSEFPVDIMLSPIETAEGRVTVSVIRDISEREKAEEALRQTEERFHLLVENIRDHAIFMMDVSGRVISWNPGAERLKGYRADEIIGRSYSCFYTPEDIERGIPEESLRLAAARGRFEREGWRVRKDGSRFWANAVITSIRNKTGLHRAQEGRRSPSTQRRAVTCALRVFSRRDHRQRSGRANHASECARGKHVRL